MSGGLHTGIEVDLRRGWAYMLRRRVKLAAYLAAIVSILVTQGVIHGVTVEFWIYLAIGVIGGGVLHQAPNVEKGRKP